MINGAYSKTIGSMGVDTRIGQYVIAENDVHIGNDCKIGHRVTLKEGTIIKDHSIIDDHCCTTGACFIGEHVNIRTGAIISKATIIEDWVFVGPGVITNHTKHVDHGRLNMVNEQLLTYISYGPIIGSQCSIVAGVYIGPHSIIGAGSVVTKDIEGNGIYFGNPAKRIKDIPVKWRIMGYDTFDNIGKMYLRKDIMKHLAKYIPHLRYSRFIDEHPFLEMNSGGN